MHLAFVTNYFYGKKYNIGIGFFSWLCLPASFSSLSPGGEIFKSLHWNKDDDDHNEAVLDLPPPPQASIMSCTVLKIRYTLLYLLAS